MEEETQGTFGPAFNPRTTPEVREELRRLEAEYEKRFGEPPPFYGIGRGFGWGHQKRIVQIKWALRTGVMPEGWKGSHQRFIDHRQGENRLAGKLSI